MTWPILTALVLGLWAPSSAHAGPHRSVCAKAELAGLVVEARFTVNAKYPQSHQRKQWGPPNSALRRIARTGKVVRVLKGSAKVGQPWDENWRAEFKTGSSSVKSWKKFFRQRHFSQIFFLAETKDEWRTIGWAEEHAGCGSSAHRSWCRGYPEFVRQVEACLVKLRGRPSQEKERPVPKP
jgi:hypothetical protein